MQMKVSVIIPVAPKEAIFNSLQEQLMVLPADWEILICSSEKPRLTQEASNKFKWIYSEGGRAVSLNKGAKQAHGDYLWFLHADSILAKGCIKKLSYLIHSNRNNRENALYYFDLKFIKASNHYMKPKEIGVLFRSRCLHTPFGDQGFFMKRELFEQFGPYSTEALYGEDHLLVREFRRKKIKIVPIGVNLYTSARKYEENGWVKTTLRYQYLWLKHPSPHIGKCPILRIILEALLL
jgi:glycosyltransferase involved in cell wall biosynthesis